MTCLCVSGVPLTFRWYRMMPVLSRSSSMPMRWGSSESSTTPIPSFLRARVSSCRRVHTDHSLKPEQSFHKVRTLADQWMWNCGEPSVFFHWRKHAFLPWGYSESRSICWSTPSSAPEPAHTTETSKLPQTSAADPSQPTCRCKHLTSDSLWLHSGAASPPYSELWASPGERSDNTDTNTLSGSSVTFTL